MINQVNIHSDRPRKIETSDFSKNENVSSYLSPSLDILENEKTNQNTKNNLDGVKKEF